MTNQLQRTLTDMAAGAPVARLREDTWRRGRRRRTLTHTGLAALALLAAALPAGMLLAPQGPAEPAAADTVTMPTRIARPSPAQSTLDESPNGPVIAAFESNITLRFGFAATSGVALVGRDGSYRFLPKDSGDKWLLSPDGRYLARPGELVGLMDARREAIPELLRPLAWDRTGRLLLFADGGDVYLRDLETRSQRKLFARQDGGPLGLDAAFSPDGTRLAAIWDGTLRVFDVQSGAVVWSAGIGDGRLGGPAAWTPDSRRITLLQHHEPLWRLGFIDESVQQPAWQTDRWHNGHPNAVTGWHDEDPVLVVSGASLMRVPLHDGTAQQLTAFEHGPAQVPQDVVEQAQFGGPPLSPRFAVAGFQRSYFAAAATVLLILIYLTYLVRRKRPR